MNSKNSFLVFFYIDNITWYLNSFLLFWVVVDEIQCRSRYSCSLSLFHTLEHRLRYTRGLWSALSYCLVALLSITTTLVSSPSRRIVVTMFAIPSFSTKRSRFLTIHSLWLLPYICMVRNPCERRQRSLFNTFIPPPAYIRGSEFPK